MHKTIILADDHILLRNALSSLINSFPEFTVITMAGDGMEVVSAIEAGAMPDIVIVDLSMPIMDGYETTNWLYANYPKIKILILTMFDSEIALIRLLQKGVRGFLKKDIHPEELHVALLAVANDGFYYSHQATGKLGDLLKRNKDNHISMDIAILSNIEIHILKMVCTEFTYKEIASQMKLSPRVIDNYRDALFDKLNVRSRVGLAIYAVKNGMVTF